MHFNPILHEKKEFFYPFANFFQQRLKLPERPEQAPAQDGGPGTEHSGAAAPGSSQQQEVKQSSQQHSQQHKEPELPPAGDAAQQEEQHRRQKGEGQVKEDEPLFQPAAAQSGRHQLVDEAQGRAAEKAQQGLQPLAAGVDLHQPSRRPRSPRLFSFSPA
jgi:hypothetical protein